MKKWCGMTLAIGILTATQANAQTHYGQGAGVLGPGHAFFGTSAGASNTAKGLENSFFGYESGFSNLDGVHNVFVGSQAGYMNNGGGNVFIGYRSGYENITGPFNTFIGGHTGQKNLNGGANLFGGYSTGSSNTSGNDNTFLGTQCGIENTTGDGNVFLGYNSANNNSIGSFNVFLGMRSGKGNVSGNHNTYLGYQANGDANLENATAIGANAKVAADNSVVLGRNANVGIGISAPSFQLHLSSDAAAKAGSPDWIVASDSRLKRNITDFTDGLQLLKQIRPTWFQYNGKAGIETGDKKFVGIIAQEMQKIAPYTIGTFTHQDSLGNKTEYLDYDANAVTYILINSVKEQQQVIEQKDAELKEINAQVAALSRRLEQLERIVAAGTAKPLTGNVARTEPNANGVVLEQNVPNGFSGSSSIRYFVPESVKEAVINVYSVNGAKVNSYAVKERGEGKLAISAGDFQNGVFLYDLVTDGRSNGVKKMVVQK